MNGYKYEALKEWDAVTKPLLKKLEEMNIDIPIGCVDKSVEGLYNKQMNGGTDE